MAGPLDQLFRNASREIKAAVAKQFYRSDVGKAMREAQSAYRSARSTPDQIRGIAQKYGNKFRAETVLRDMMGQEFGGMVRDIERYAKSGGAAKAFVSGFLKSLGPAGKLISALVDVGTKGRSLYRDLNTAAELLNSYGWITIPPPGTRSGIGMKGVPRHAGGVEGLIEALTNLGYSVIPPSEEIRGGKAGKTVPKVAPTGTVAAPSEEKEKLVSAYPANHPVNTGAMVLTPQSSNVHSYGYDAEKEYLYVRFYAAAPYGEARMAPGPLYRYSSVAPQEFVSMHQATSKGTWVWDRLRNRGTFSGHKKPYELVGVMNGYVPRRATLGHLTKAGRLSRNGRGQFGEIWTTEGRRVKDVVTGRIMQPTKKTVLVRPLQKTISARKRKG